jgi:TnpA family transposase
VIVSRRRPHNRLGFAIQLCGLRYRGGYSDRARSSPRPLAFVGEQLGIAPEALADYAARGPTRYEQLDTTARWLAFSPSPGPFGWSFRRGSCRLR